MANYKITKRTKKDKEGNILGTEPCIVADMEKVTSAERAVIETYVKSGYPLYPRKPKKASGKGYTKEKMIKHLEEINDTKGLAELQAMLEEKRNFMQITAWYRKNYVPKKDKKDKKK